MSSLLPSAALPFGAPRALPRHAFTLLNASPGAERSEVDPGLLVLNPSLGVWNSCFLSGVASPAEFFRVLILQNTLQADVLELTPLRAKN